MRLMQFSVFVLVLVASALGAGNPQDIARELLQAARADSDLVKPEDKAAAQQSIGQGYARLGDLDAAAKSGLSAHADPGLALTALLARGDMERAQSEARAINIGMYIWRADAFVEVAESLVRRARAKEAANLLHEAFWSDDGGQIRPPGDYNDEGYNEQVERVRSKLATVLTEIKDWGRMRQWNVLSGQDFVQLLVKSGEFEIAAAEASKVGIEDVSLAVELIQKLADNHQVADLDKICQAATDAASRKLKKEPDWGAYGAGKSDDDYGADFRLVPLAEAAARYISVEAAQRVALDLYQDESVQVEALVRAALVRHAIRDEKGFDLLLRKAKANAPQCKRYLDQVDARQYVVRGLVLAGDVAAAEEYVRLAKEKSDVLGEEMARMVATTERTVRQEGEARELTGSATPTSYYISGLVRNLKPGEATGKAFRQAAMIGAKDTVDRLIAYIHLGAVAPQAAEWKDVRQVWKERRSTAHMERDPMVRMWNLSEVCQLQIASFGIGDADVKATLEALVGTELPPLAVDDGKVYKLDPLINAGFRQVELNEVLAWGARGEIARGSPERAEMLLSGIASSPDRGQTARLLGEEVVRAFVEKGDLESAERLATRVRSAYVDIAKAWLKQGNAKRAFKLSRMEEAVADVALAKGVKEAIQMMEVVDDPRERVALLTGAARVLTSGK